MIDAQEHQKTQNNNAIFDLEAAVTALKEDMSNYLVFMQTMFAKDANVRARNRLCSEYVSLSVLQATNAL